MKKIKMLTIIAVAAITFITKAEAQQKPPPPPPPPPAQIHADIDVRAKMNEVLKSNPAVADFSWEKKNLMVVKLKNGETEKYNMEDVNQKKSFIDEYGDVPAFLPPPPLPPPPTIKEKS